MTGPNASSRANQAAPSPRWTLSIEAAVSTAERPSAIAWLPGNGWAAGTWACTKRRPQGARSRPMIEGDGATSGKKAAPKSCLNPGRVDSRVLAAPPRSSLASSRHTDQPFSARRMAAASPLDPPPQTIAS